MGGVAEGCGERGQPLEHRLSEAVHADWWAWNREPMSVSTAVPWRGCERKDERGHTIP